MRERSAAAIRRDETAFRAIIFYKSARAVLLGSIAIVLALLSGSWLPWALDTAMRLRQHLVSDWSVRVADILIANATKRKIELTCIALGLDSVLSAIEGWALHYRHWWGPWLVVAASGSLLPFEVAQLYRAVHVGRILLLAGNLAIVLFLARRALREHRERVARER